VSDDDPGPGCCGPGSVFGRRAFIGGGALFCASVALPGSAAAQAGLAEARAALNGALTIDIHSHAGRIIGRRNITERPPYAPVAAPMREGGMAVICFTIVADTPTLELTAERRIVATRDPAPGELYEWSRDGFARLHGLVQEQGLHVITGIADLSDTPKRGPSIIVASEGADFLEGRIERLEEAFRQQRLRHLQLTHYRPNELGDIQTVAPVHGGLTAFGAEVIRQCNRLGIVVDIAHGTFDLVKRAAAVTTKPLVLSHTSLANRPLPFSRLISPNHARLVASTGGVIGIWPPSTIFPDIAALAAGIARMVDAAGIDHVGLGTDMSGLTAPPTFASYRQLPDLAAALMARGFNAAEVRKLLGGNYARVFAATLGNS
jgi:membrane dipeptidase